MKAKIGFLLAAFLMLFSVSANAQSGETPIKGDVNGDGVVDIADINAIIDIMKNGGGTGGETKYYWYVGTVYPTDPNNPDENTGYIPSTIYEGWNMGYSQWTQLTSTPDRLSIETDRVSPTIVWYVAIPHSYSFHAYDTSGSARDEAAFYEDLITINGVQYTLFTSSGKRPKVNAVFRK